MSDVTINCAVENWPLRTPFRISREVMSEAPLLVVTVTDGPHKGWGEACPAPHFGETVESASQQIHALGGRCDLDADLQELLPAGSARNALDCALWDLRAKRAGRRVWDLLEVGAPTALETAFTLGLASPEDMAHAAAASPHRLLKLKLGGPADLERLSAVRAAVPDKRLIADANEGWTPDFLAEVMPTLKAHRLELIEQPLPAGGDEALAEIPHLVPIGADEACRTSDDLPRISRLYDAVNIKLDKTGGLTGAMRLLEQAEILGLKTMVGCMLGTSLAMAPAVLVAQYAAWIDLDAPLLAGHDRPHGLTYVDGRVFPPTPALWG